MNRFEKRYLGDPRDVTKPMMSGKHDRASELRAIADGRLLLNVRNGVTISRSMLARIADEFEAMSTALAAKDAGLVAVKAELSGETGELIDKMAEAIRGDGGHYDETPWDILSEERKEGWRGDARRALAVVKEYLTARLPASRTVTEEMVEALKRIRDTAMEHTITAGIPECGVFGCIAQDADWLMREITAAMEEGQ